MMTSIIRAREAALAAEINNTIPELAAILDQAYGVLIYDKTAVEEGRQYDWLMAVSAQDTSLGEIMKYNFDQGLASDLDDKVINQLVDEVVEFIYGGGRYAAKQYTTA